MVAHLKVLHLDHLLPNPQLLSGTNALAYFGGTSISRNTEFCTIGIEFVSSFSLNTNNTLFHLLGGGVTPIIILSTETNKRMTKKEKKREKRFSFIYF
jgi:hypothetical protein